MNTTRPKLAFSLRRYFMTATVPAAWLATVPATLLATLPATLLATLPATLLASLLLIQMPALALSPDLKDGISAYNKGDYKEAVSHLSAALSQDFNNAVLHYYLANSFVNLGQKESAIREFRIAYALEPEKEAGKLSKLALKYLGAESAEAAPEKKTPTPPPKTAEELKREAAMQKLKEQLSRDSEINQKSASQSAESTSRHGNASVDAQRQAILEGLRYYRRGRLQQLPMPQDSARQLELLKSLWEGQANSQYQQAEQRRLELEKTAQNLNELMQDKRKGGHKLVPESSNLYIRTYQSHKEESKSNDKTKEKSGDK
jgi:ribonuclease HI